MNKVELSMAKVGKVIHYFTAIGVAVVELSGNLKVGEKIKFEGATTDFEQTVDSMQVDKKEIQEAKKGTEIGLKVADRVREGDTVSKIS
jgi:putative protease